LIHAIDLPGLIVEKSSDEKLLIDTHNLEKLRFGLANHIQYYKIKKTKNTVVEQRSGRKRLYDHNIILRSIFRNQIIHRKYGPLGDLLNQAIYIDFGSAILYEEGAVTVRDLYEDNQISSNLQTIVATDINDPSYDHTRYIEIHEKEREPFPFPHSEIPTLMNDPMMLQNLVNRFTKDQYAPVIFRSTNSGPDLFYTVDEMVAHFRSVLEANPDRNILYFFNRFVFFRHACESKFQMIGKIDEKIGVNHSYSAWRFVDWNTRTLKDAFYPHYDYLLIGLESEIPRAELLEMQWKQESCKINKQWVAQKKEWRSFFTSKSPSVASHGK